MTITECKLCKSIGQIEPAYVFEDERKENKFQESIKFVNRSLWISPCFGKNKRTQNHILESKVPSILKKIKKILHCISQPFWPKGLNSTSFLQHNSAKLNSLGIRSPKGH